MTQDSLFRAIRTFVITTLGLFVPGLLGWLHELTNWAKAEGEVPFPDGKGLAFLGVSACVAGVVAVVNLIWNVIEEGTGKAMWRAVPAKPPRRQAGQGLNNTLWTVFLVLGIIALIVWLL
jgi:hypothetical protein